MLPLYILTHQRPDRQTTYDNLPPKWQKQVTFVVQDGAAIPLAADHTCTIILPPEVKNLHQTRQYLLDRVHEGCVVEMDDDIVFSARREDDPTKFRKMLWPDFDLMFDMMELHLTVAPLVGVVAREGANRDISLIKTAARQMRLHAFDSRVLRAEKCRWDLLRSPGPEDFCMILQLLTLGYPNTVMNQWCQNQGGSNTSGGCSTYRTPEIHADACQHLHELFPDFVTVVDKTTKEAWGGGTRKDVRIQWKSAYKFGVQEHNHAKQ